MKSKDFSDVLSFIVDKDFKDAIKDVESCSAFMMSGYSIDETLADYLSFVCKRFLEVYETSVNGM